jgi:uncharacterized membrane protein YkvA (DUF1232 family)
MPFDLSRARTILLQVPQQGKLAYCLLRDPRVPVPPKVALLGALGLIASPIDFPAWIPVVGDFDMLALGILAVKVFVDACPAELVEEHKAGLKAGDSRFDRDLRRVLGIGVGAARQVGTWISGRGAPRELPSGQVEERSV